MASRTVELSEPRAVARLWGEFAIDDRESGASLRPRGRKARALLAYLIVHAGRPIGRDRLTGLLWGERAEEQARASLRQALFELRALARGSAPLLRVDRETVMVEPGAIATELDRVRRLHDAGELVALGDALPGPDDIFLASLDGIDLEYDAWLRLERSRQDERLAACVAEALATARRQGDPRLAREFAARLAELDRDGGGDAAGRRDEAVRTPVPAPAAPASPPPSRARAMAPWLALALVGCTAATAPWLILRGDFGRNRAEQEAQALTASAGTMLRARSPGEVKAATELLRRAVEVDPGFAPAWARLAAARVMSDYTEPGRREAERLARRALQLDPGLAEAHGTLGMVLGFAGREAGQHLVRAVALDPQDAQLQFWLSNYLSNRLRFGPRMQALRRAVEIDPGFPRAKTEAALAAWELGRRDEARSYLGRMTESEADACTFGIALSEGKLVDVVRAYGRGAERAGAVPGRDMRAGAALLVLGYVEPARLLMRLPAYQWTVARGGTPSPAEFRLINRNADDDWFDSHVFLDLATQRLLAAGRAAELVAAYDSADRGQLGLLAGDEDRQALILSAPDLVVALRAMGRTADAASLLARADRLVRQAYAAGPVPNWFDAQAARLWAVEGRDAAAIAALRRAVARGWRYTPITPRPDLAQIHAFRRLRTHPDFVALRAMLARQLAAQREELGPKPI